LSEAGGKAFTVRGALRSGLAELKGFGEPMRHKVRAPHRARAVQRRCGGAEGAVWHKPYRYMLLYLWGLGIDFGGFFLYFCQASEGLVPL
jgi:hypothetical protein